MAAMPREPLFGGGISIGAGTLPFALFEATEGGRLSAIEAVEFWRALEEAGRGLAGGAGDARGGLDVSGNAPMTGEDATDGGCAGPALRGVHVSFHLRCGSQGSDEHLPLLGLPRRVGQCLSLLLRRWLFGCWRRTRAL